MYRILYPPYFESLLLHSFIFQSFSVLSKWGRDKDTFQNIILLLLEKHVLSVFECCSIKVIF